MVPVGAQPGQVLEGLADGVGHVAVPGGDRLVEQPETALGGVGLGGPRGDRDARAVDLPLLGLELPRQTEEVEALFGLVVEQVVHGGEVDQLQGDLLGGELGDVGAEQGCALLGSASAGGHV